MKSTSKLLLILFILFGVPDQVFGQEEAPVADTAQVASTNILPKDTTLQDTIRAVEDAPLDIGNTRGLFITTDDQRMQLRILGSVRYLIVFDGIDLPTKITLSTVEIPTGERNVFLPNYYNGLVQSRLGFEVTRKIGEQQMFIRLETDFAGISGFRIRHAYGQFQRFLFGQTWSLFAQVLLRPPTVSTGGPTGSISRRTPQVRFMPSRLIPKADLALALEYSTPNIEELDSLSVQTFQLIPDITGRINRQYSWGSLQVSAIFPFLTGRQDNGKLIVRPGWGLSTGLRVDSWLNGKWYFHLAGGRGVTRFFNDIGTQGLDLLIDPESLQAILPFTWGGYLGYNHQWHQNLQSGIIYGRLQTQKINVQPDNSYRHGESLRFNTFWKVVEGATLGAEVTVANRVDKDKADGSAVRISLLFYYDF